jgi:hypothetical protein
MTLRQVTLIAAMFAAGVSSSLTCVSAQEDTSKFRRVPDVSKIGIERRFETSVFPSSGSTNPVVSPVSSLPISKGGPLVADGSKAPGTTSDGENYASPGNGRPPTNRTGFRRFQPASKGRIERPLETSLFRHAPIPIVQVAPPSKGFIERPLETSLMKTLNPLPYASRMSTDSKSSLLYAEPRAGKTVQPGLVNWQNDFAAAVAKASQTNRPVLLFQMMGKLNDEFC